MLLVGEVGGWMMVVKAVILLIVFSKGQKEKTKKLSYTRKNKVEIQYYRRCDSESRKVVVYQ